MRLYCLIIPKSVIRKLRRIDPQDQRYIKTALQLLRESPYQRGTKKLKNVSLGIFRARIRDYRIRYDIKGKTIIIRRIGHRKEVYN